MLVFFGFSLPFRHRECDLGGVQKGFSFFLSFSFADLSVPARRTQPSSQHGGAPSGPISRGLIPPLPIFDNVETTFFFFFFFFTLRYSVANSSLFPVTILFASFLAVFVEGAILLRTGSRRAGLLSHAVIEIQPYAVCVCIYNIYIIYIIYNYICI